MDNVSFKNDLKPGMQVLFGRSHGEKTLGIVVRVNARSVTVKQAETRGTMRAYPVGTIWRVARSMVQPVSGFSPAGAVSKPVAQAPRSARPESAVLQDIGDVYSQLSPENLTCDGELPRREIARRRAALQRQLKALFVELGREVDEMECYAMWEAQAQARRQA